MKSWHPGLSPARAKHLGAMSDADVDAIIAGRLPCYSIVEQTVDRKNTSKNCKPRGVRGRKMAVYTDLGEPFESITDAAKALGIFPAAISQAVRLGYRAAGRKWFRVPAA